MFFGKGSGGAGSPGESGGVRGVPGFSGESGVFRGVRGFPGSLGVRGGPGSPGAFTVALTIISRLPPLLYLSDFLLFSLFQWFSRKV